MKEVKLKERFENAFNAFFDNEKLNDDNSLIIPNYSAFYQTDENLSFWEKHKTLINILKQVFLFLPGVFVLFFMSVDFTGFVILRPTSGAEHHLYLAGFVTLVSAIMTFLGLGSWRNTKHLFIPLSVVALSLFLGIIGSITHGVEGFGYFIDHYAAYFLPLAYILPILAKGLADQKSEDA
jgi:hypothetical protein